MDAEPVPLLRCHSEYSFTHGMLRLSGERELGALAAQRGLWAVALTDTGNVCGAIEHCRSCLDHGVKPILGCHASFALEGREHRATLLCENRQGFLNLSRLLTAAHLDGGGTIDAASLGGGDTEGLIMLTGYEGDVCAALRRDGREEAARRLAFWGSAFGRGNLCCELAFGGRPGEAAATRMLAALAKEQGVPSVASHPAMFADDGDFEAHEVRVCIAEGSRLDDSGRVSPYTRDQCVPDAVRMRSMFAGLPQALANANEIARRCNYDFGVGAAPQFPRIPGTGHGEAPARLRELATKGVEGMLAGMPGADSPAYMARLDEELGVITDKGFSDYFLIVAEIVGHARERGIPVGPGRGSGAGSLVARSLGITKLDPIEHDLLFERFLNPERTSLPDFDIDFCKDRREEVIAHAREAYGEDCVSQVITFGRLKAKAVVRDVCRVLGMPYTTGDTVSKLIPDELNITLSAARAKAQDLDGMVSGDGELERLWSFSLALEGIARQASTHAAAVLISPRPLVEFCPLIRVGDKSGHAVSQYDMNSADEVGLIKFDFLGLKNLTMLERAQDMVRRRDGGEGFDVDGIDLGDGAMFDVYREGRTAGVFQCESRGMVELLRRISPSSLDDVAIAISLFRPGPLESRMDDMFIENRADPAGISYPHPSVKAVLEPTFGSMIYQEQVMRISQLVAGFTLAKADVMRAAIGKKNTEVMEALAAEFVAGCEGKLARKEAQRLFRDIEKFAGYGFNKSHAISYALISLQTAYLKAHHRAEFFASSLSTWFDDQVTQANLLGDAKAHGVGLLPPDVNRSSVNFVPAGEGAIRFGLVSIHGVGRAFTEALVEERGRNGPYKDLFDMCLRTKLGSVRMLDSLVNAGACDCLAPDVPDKRAARAAMARQCREVVDGANHARAHANQESLFGDLPSPGNAGLRIGESWPTSRLLLGEQETLGMTLSGKFTDLLGLLPGVMDRLVAAGESAGRDKGTWVGQLKRKVSKAATRGGGWVNLAIESSAGECEVLARPQDLEDLPLSRPGQLLVVRGAWKAQAWRTNPFVSAESVQTIDQWLQSKVESVTIDLTDDRRAMLDWLLAFLREGEGVRGRSRLRFRLGNGDGEKVVDTNDAFAPRLDDLAHIGERLGAGALQIRLGG